MTRVSLHEENIWNVIRKVVYLGKECNIDYLQIGTFVAQQNWKKL